MDSPTASRPGDDSHDHPTSAADDSFRGAVVVSLESRRGEEMRRFIERWGGEAHVSPSMRESSVSDAREAIEFAHRLIAGQVDLMIFLTGVGARMFVDAVSRGVDRGRLLDALSDVPTLVRGPKPLAVLREWGVTPTMRAPAPNTWREVLATLDAHHPVANLIVGVQEYGEPNPSLVAGLEARGATVDTVRVYEWELPEDQGPLERNARLLAEGRVDVVLFTSANQANNLLAVADRIGIGEPARRGLREAVVASVGPTTSERLRALGLPIDIEASNATMGRLVQDAAQQWAEVARRKRLVGAAIAATRLGDAPTRHDPATPRREALRLAARGTPWETSDFLRACRGEPTRRTPVWLMRQAGRYMPEYRAVREKVGFLELCRNPSLCSEVMCTAVAYLGVDAAILFSDLLPILEPMGMELEFSPGDGPVIHNPVRDPADVDRVIDLESIDALHYVVEAVRRTRADLPGEVPLIGFAGAPFTLASYAIEGGGSRNYLHTKTLMLRDEGAWAELMRRLARSVALYLNAQVGAGAQAVQVFDSWVGCLAPDDYRRYVLPYTRELIAAIDPAVPVIHFAAGNPALAPLAAEAGGDIIGVDWRVRLADAWDAIGSDRAVQGNLDPHSLLASPETIRRRAHDLLDSVAGRAGHVFNLGHGVVPQTPPEHARALVEFVHEHRPAAQA